MTKQHLKKQALDLESIAKQLGIEDPKFPRPAKSRRNATAPARNAVKLFFQFVFPKIKKLKIKHGHHCFVARAKWGNRVLYAKAYSIERLVVYFAKEYQEKVLI